MSEQRAAPFYCPYCGEQDLRPVLAERAYHCRTCDRTFRLEFVSLGKPSEQEEI